ncbi:hypothetical protein DM860_017183 [Cuscuta australis]|uniref:Uncharacterized protein n=1 Tax=Cuscuta australis TaxID=267555 RepID=A0A328DYC8_9ASTE|nr:hypothetical protein DM860_017183 [Cuscuta australis]
MEPMRRGDSLIRLRRCDYAVEVEEAQPGSQFDRMRIERMRVSEIPGGGWREKNQQLAEKVRLISDGSIEGRRLVFSLCARAAA